MNANLIVRLIKLSFSILIVGVLFKIMHWPFTQVIMTIGFGMIVLLYPIRFYLKQPKRVIDYVKLVLAICLPINTYLNLFHLQSHFLLPILSFSSFILWLILELYDSYKNIESKDFKIFPFGILSVIVLFILVGAFFKLSHYPYANYILIFGFALLTVYFLIDTFKS